MLKGIFVGILITSFCLGLLWFFAGRADLIGILATAKEIRGENGTAQSIGNTLSIRLDGIERTATRASNQGTELESGARVIESSSIWLSEESQVIEQGLRDIVVRVESGERRHGKIIGIVGTLRSLNERFREANQKSNLEE